MRRMILLGTRLSERCKRRPDWRYAKPHPQASLILRRLCLFVTVLAVAVFISARTASAHIDSLIPSEAVAGGPDFTLRVIGEDLQPGERVLWNGAPLATTYVSTTEVTAIVPASLIANPGIAVVTLEGFNSLNFTITNPRLTITTASPLPEGVVGQPYSHTLMRSGGTGPFTWGDLSPLPPGLSLSADGTLSGRPTTAGSFTFTVEVMDALYDFDTKDISLVIQEAECSYSISPAQRVVNASGMVSSGSTNSHTLSVTAPPNCSWTATANVDWIKFDSPLSGDGEKIFSYTVESNAGFFRAGSISVAGQTHLVYQNPRNCPVNLICLFLPHVCGINSNSVMDQSRAFRDRALAQTPRGQRYTRLYYQFSNEVVQMLMLNPVLILRSREMIERYMPVVEAMARGEQVTLTSGDIEEIERFLRSFAAKGSQGLKESIKALCEDLRDPQVHREFDIITAEGPKREMPAAGGLQTVKQTGLMLAPLGVLLLVFYRTRGKTRKAVLKRLLLAAVLFSVIGCQWPTLSAGVTRPMMIDRPPASSTYFGGNGIEEGNNIAVDSAGNIYVTGFTDSATFPVVNASQPSLGGGQQDAFVAKLDPTGTRLLYSTYIGGDGQDNGTGIAVDSGGNAYITGFTDSTNFPLKNALQPARRGDFNAFVVKLDPAGSILNSTLFGGSANDYGSSIAVDTAGNVYIAGIATSPDIPMTNALQPTLGGPADVYVAKIDLSGARLFYSTYLGGEGIDGASSIAVDTAGNVYLTGITSSRDFRTVGALQTTHGGGLFDAFVAKLNAQGAQVLYSTFLGGSGEDRAFRIAVDSAGSAYVTGDTGSMNFPLANALQPANGGNSDAFVAKLNPSGSALAYSTYLGGSDIEGGTGLAVDPGGSAYVTGFTGSNDLPTAAALQQTSGGSFDAFVAKLSPGGMALDYSTYLGGNGRDSGFGAAVDSSGNAYVMGVTDSTDFPVRNPLQQAYGGGATDLFIARIKQGPAIDNVMIDGKRLLVTGSGFDQGARILVNGQQQKTANDPQSPTTSLIGKKTGKKIARGQTVTLQVRNLDGGLSNEFSFTRPVQ